MGAGEGALGSWGKRIWMSRCFHLFTFQSPPGEHWQIWGRSPPWQICVLSIYVLLNLFLSAAWDWTRTERWLADKKEGREEKKGSFQHFNGVCSVVAIPLLPETLFYSGHMQGNQSLYLALCMSSECWSCLLFQARKALNAHMKKSMQCKL